MPVKSGSASKAPGGRAQRRDEVRWEYLELLVGVGNEIWDSNGNKMELREIQVGDPRFPRHYYSAAPLLNELGRDGWEVSGLIGDLSTYIIVLKRLRRGADDDVSSTEQESPAVARSVAERLGADAKAGK